VTCERDPALGGGYINIPGRQRRSLCQTGGDCGGDADVGETPCCEARPVPCPLSDDLPGLLEFVLEIVGLPNRNPTDRFLSVFFVLAPPWLALMPCTGMCVSVW